MNPALHGLTLGLAALFAAAPLAVRAELPQQHFSVSLSQQFTIYCSDSQARFNISSAAEQIKTGVLSVLGQKDLWKAPIVINVRRADPTEPGAPAAAIHMVELDQGFKVELQIRIGQDPSEIHFQEQLVRAILLEFAYRNHPVVKGGTEYTLPPEWISQGIIQILLKKAGQNDDSDIFKSIIDTNRLMPLNKFLAQKSGDLDSASLALYKAYSLCLVTLLSQTNNGPSHLAQFLRNVPDSSGMDPSADLAKAFPDLGTTEKSMEKWWSLSVARLSAENRFRGLNLNQTEARLVEALKLRFVEPNGEARTVELEDFKAWFKQKPAKAALAALNGKLLDLALNAHPLLRSTITEYQVAALSLAMGKTRGIADRLAKLKQRRANVTKLMSDIEDTMNWYEATQLNVNSHAFDSYFKKSKQWESQAPKRTDQISICLDQLETEMK